MKGLLIDIAILMTVALVALIVGLCRAAGKGSRAEEAGESSPDVLERDANRLPSNPPEFQKKGGFLARVVTRITGSKDRELTLRQKRALEAANRGFRVVKGGRSR